MQYLLKIVTCNHENETRKPFEKHNYPIAVDYIEVNDVADLDFFVTNCN
ncbi:hypothetical protein OROGR_007116 [Orobanche gracilis]